MPVGLRKAEHQRNTLDIHDEVTLAAQPASVCGIVAGVYAPPRGLGTLTPSKLVRLKSSHPALQHVAMAATPPGILPLAQPASVAYAFAKAQLLLLLLSGASCAQHRQ